MNNHVLPRAALKWQLHGNARINFIPVSFLFLFSLSVFVFSFLAVHLRASRDKNVSLREAASSGF